MDGESIGGKAEKCTKVYFKMAIKSNQQKNLSPKGIYVKKIMKDCMKEVIGGLLKEVMKEIMIENTNEISKGTWRKIMKEDHLLTYIL